MANSATASSSATGTGKEKQTLFFELVTPEESLMSLDSSMVVLPGTEGYVGILANHAPMVFELGTGILEIFVDGKNHERVFLSGGFANVVSDRCTVLAEEATLLSTIDVSQLDDTIKNMQRVIEQSDTDTVIASAQERLMRARIMKTAIERGPVVQQLS